MLSRSSKPKLIFFIVLLCEGADEGAAKAKGIGRAAGAAKGAVVAKAAGLAKAAGIGGLVIEASSS